MPSKDEGLTLYLIEQNKEKRYEITYRLSGKKMNLKITLKTEIKIPKNMKFFLIPLSLITLYVNAQQVQLPETIPPSPQAGEFVKFLDFPMDLSSGLPEIDIPIFTIKSKELTLPISVSYHASGLRPNTDESGVVGLGWHLNASGIITRSINRQPDEKYWNFLIPQEDNIASTTDNLVADPDANVLDNIARQYKEAEPDIFSYSLPRMGGGKFVFRRSSSQAEFLKPVTLPFRPVKITPNLVQGKFEYFEVKDENGIVYRFGKSVSTAQVFYETYFDINNNQTSGITSWLLTEIISANKSDTIYFEYDDVLSSDGHTTHTKSRISHKRSVSITKTSEQPFPSLSRTTILEVYQGNGYTQKKLTKIRFKSGYIIFSYKSNRYPDYLLDNIAVYSNNLSQPTKTIRFNQTKYHSSSSSLNWTKLDAMDFYDANNAKINGYSFSYYLSSFPQIHNTYTHETYSIDFYGFYNGSNNTNLLPSFTWNGTVVGGANLFGTANRTPNYQYAMTGILTKMVNQTGGEHIFEYEGNVNSSGQKVGGLRVRSIIHKSDGSENTKTFTYQGISKHIDQSYFQSHSITEALYSMTDNFTASSEPSIDITRNGKPILYTKVTEYLGDLNTNNGRIEHHFDLAFTSPTKFDYWSISRGYPWVNGNGQFSAGPLMVSYDDVVFGNVYENETKFFDSYGNPVRQINNYYSHDLKQRLNGFTVSRAVNSVSLPNKAYFYIFYNYNIDQLTQKLDSTTTIEYLGDHSLTTKSEYKYNSDLLIIEKKSKNSDNIDYISRYKYPIDFAPQAPYDDMVNNRNIISPVIEELQFKGAVPTQSIKINYKNWGNNVIAPDSVQAKTSTGIYETRFKYNSYDTQGNVLNISKDGGLKISYLWGYDRALPIASATNAAENQIAYTSFENENNEGGWSFNRSSGVSAISMTGKFSFKGTTISKIALPSTRYKVGYWVRKIGTSNGIVTINGSSNTIANSNWEYREFITASNVTSITISLSGVCLDELRLCPFDAQMTTYTYDPLIGLTSKTDENNIITFYHYDDFDRLKLVKDHEGNIIRVYDYHYKQN